MTIKDVAAYCGVSVSTVSRALNNHPDVSERVKNKVMKAVEELHYVPNNSARDLSRSRSVPAIGVVARGEQNPFFSDMFSDIDREIQKEGYEMVLQQISPVENELEAGAALVRTKKLSGLIFLGGEFNYTPDQTAALGVPFICSTYTNSFGTLDPDSYSSVCIDDQKEARRAVEYLIAHGNRKIAILLDAVNDHSISELRLKGYLDALEAAGIEPDMDYVQESGEYEMSAAYEGTRRLLERKDDFTALFVIADSLAIAAMKALTEWGKRIPEDCSVISIDGIETSKYTMPTLTTLIQPREIMARRTVQILCRVIRGEAANEHLYLDTSLREGASVGFRP